MGVESLQTLSIFFYISGGILFVVAIVLFFALKIPKAFGLVTGLTAARGIKKIQQRNNKRLSSNASSTVNGTLQSSTRPMELESPQTSKIATTNLTSEKKDEKFSASDTTLLNVNAEFSLPVENPDAVFTVIQELSFTSSVEVIE